MPEPLSAEEIIEAGDSYFLSDDREDNAVDVLKRIETQIMRIADVFEEAMRAGGHELKM